MIFVALGTPETLGYGILVDHIGKRGGDREEIRYELN